MQHDNDSESMKRAQPFPLPRVCSPKAFPLPRTGGKRSRYPVYAFRKGFLYDETNGLWGESKLVWQRGQACPDSGDWELHHHWLWNRIASEFTNGLYIKAL
jgi:hypothetical protein